MDQRLGPNEHSCEFADDLLKGADAIGYFIFGPGAHRRKIYYLLKTSRMPHFRIGSQLCARRSVLLAWFGKQEAKSGVSLPARET